MLCGILLLRSQLGEQCIERCLQGKSPNSCLQGNAGNSNRERLTGLYLFFFYLNRKSLEGSKQETASLWKSYGTSKRLTDKWCNFVSQSVSQVYRLSSQNWIFSMCWLYILQEKCPEPRDVPRKPWSFSYFLYDIRQLGFEWSLNDPFFCGTEPAFASAFSNAWIFFVTKRSRLIKLIFTHISISLIALSSSFRYSALRQ